jgi:hypothetical protein
MRACIVCPVELYHLPPPALPVQLPRIHVEIIFEELVLEFMRSLDMLGEREGYTRKLSQRPELSSAVPCFACRTPACECQNEIRECCTAADISSRGAGQRQ